MPERYHIDFSQVTMNTTLANDKRIPPLYTLVQNVSTASEGSLSRRDGYENVATDTPLTAGSAAINGVTPTVIGNTGTVLANAVAVTPTKIYFLSLRVAGWSDVTPSVPTDAVGYQYAWGLNASQVQVVYLAPSSATAGGKIFSVTHALGTTVLLGQGANGFVTARCCAYFLNRLWVGGSAKSGSVQNDLVQYSVAGDHNDFNGTGSGTLSLKPPYGLNNTMEGMAVYNGRLYFAAGASLMVLTGTTPSTFGAQFVTRVNIVAGATMIVAGGYLWWVDTDGIWQFNGAKAVNIHGRDILGTTIPLVDISYSSSSWDERQGIVRFFFPTSSFMLEYNYNHQTWKKQVFAGATPINVIGPPCAKLEGDSVNYLMGGTTSGKVYVSHNNTTTDDGTTPTMTLTSGAIHLAAMSNQGTYGDEFRIVALELHCKRQTSNVTYKITWQTDTQPTAESQRTLTVTGTTATDIPYVVNANALLPTHRTGKYLQFTLVEETASVISSLRGMTFYFDVMKRN